MQYPGKSSDVVCLSHLRWNYVFQRPQHLMVRFARHRRVFYFEEPVFDATEPRLEISRVDVTVVTPHLPGGMSPAEEGLALRRLFRKLCEDWQITQPLLWFYTPMAWPIVKGTLASAIVYDCMDELSGFSGAPPEIRARERELMSAADLMFTGGYSLYEAKRSQHPNVHPVPSSVDAAHFRQARRCARQPADQREIPRPRIGFCGVIDERMNLDLVRGLSIAHPEWHFVMLGPVTKIDESALPRGENLHYLGMKPYEELPAYLSGWDVAFLPFAHNAATRFISPTKTPEYLAAGCPVVSTSIRDVVRPYGEMGLVAIADTVRDCGAAMERALAPGGRDCLSAADAFLATQSWDRTWSDMNAHVLAAESSRLRPALQPALARAEAATL